MSFVDLATLSLHRRHEIEARIKIFLEKCDNAVQNIDKLKSQACGFVDRLNCDPTELKDRFLSTMRQLDEYTYLITEFNLVIGKLDIPNNTYYTSAVQDEIQRPMLVPTVVSNYNLMDALSEPTPSTSKTCANMCPAEKEKRPKLPREEQLLIAFSSASCSSESVPLVSNEKQVQCQIEMKNLKLEDSPCTDNVTVPQSVLQVDQEYPAMIMHTDAPLLYVITEDCQELINFLMAMTNYYKDNEEELKTEDILGLAYCAFYDDDSACYYRGFIVRQPNEDLNTAELFLLDTGEMRCAPITKLQRLHPQFCTTPPYARCCYLAGLADACFETKEAMEHYTKIMKKYDGTHCTIRVDDNTSESLGVYVILPSGEILNDLVMPNDLPEETFKPGTSGTARSRSGDSELDDRNFDITQCPEYEDPVEAVTGYRNRDEMDICKHYKGGPEKTCFKGGRCKKRHVLMHPDGWTLDRVKVLGRVPALELPPPGSSLRVYVTHIPAYDTLFVQIHDQQDSAAPSFGVIVPPTTLTRLVNEMNSQASVIAYKPLTMVPANGELVAAQYPPDGKWYRARVLSTTPADQNIEVRYIDYGNTLWVREDAVRALEPRWCALPEQALPCVLAGVAVDSQTSAALLAARNALVGLAKERWLKAYVLARDFDQITVELFDEEGFSIADQLLTNPHVKPKPYLLQDDRHVTQKIVVP